MSFLVNQHPLDKELTDFWESLAKFTPDEHDIIRFNDPRKFYRIASGKTMELLYDPVARISAEDALLHYYFRNNPRPTPSHKLPKDVGGQTHQYKLEEEEKRGTKRKLGEGMCIFTYLHLYFIYIFFLQQKLDYRLWLRSCCFNNNIFFTFQPNKYE